MRKFLHIILFLVVCFLAHGCSQDKRPQYKNLAFQFRMSYDPLWEVKEKVGSAIVAFVSPKADDSDFLQETLTVSIEDLDEAVSLSEYTRRVLELTQSLDKLKDVDVLVAESSETTLSRRPAHKLIYTMTQYGNPPEFIEAGITPSVDAEGTTVQIMLVCSIVDMRVYLLTYVGQGPGFVEHLPVVEDMLRSFRFL